jgi:hypothetical protein
MICGRLIERVDVLDFVSIPIIWVVFHQGRQHIVIGKEKE